VSWEQSPVSRKPNCSDDKLNTEFRKAADDVAFFILWRRPCILKKPTRGMMMKSSRAVLLSLLVLNFLTTAMPKAAAANRTCSEIFEVNTGAQKLNFSVGQVVRIKDMKWPHSDIVILMDIATVSQISYKMFSSTVKKIEIVYKDGTKEWKNPSDVTPQVSQLGDMRRGDEVLFTRNYHRRAGRRIRRLKALASGHIDGFFDDKSILIKTESGELFHPPGTDVLARMAIGSDLDGFSEGMAVSRSLESGPAFEGWIVALYSDGTAIVRNSEKSAIIAKVYALEHAAAEPLPPGPRVVIKQIVLQNSAEPFPLP
jgi:hypothetical protein